MTKTSSKFAVVEAPDTEAALPLPSISRLPFPKPWEAAETVREHFRRVYSTIRRGGKESLAIAICSVSRGEGVSYVAAKLACAAAEVESPVFLLDANRGNPAQARVFGLENGAGSRLAADGAELLVARKTSWPSLSVVSPENASDADRGTPAGLLNALTAMRPLARITIVDCEAQRESSQVIQLAPALDGVFFVVEAERERREAVADAITQLKRAEIPVLGLIVNKQRNYLPRMLSRAL